MASERSLWRAAVGAVEPLESRCLLAAAPGTLPTTHVATTFDIADLLADTVRDRVYVADSSDRSIRVIDTDLARQVATIRLAGKPEAMAISPDDATLVVTLPDTGKFQVVSLVTLTSIRVVDLGGVRLSHPVIGAGGKLYAVASKTVTGTKSYPVQQFDLVGGGAGVAISTDAYDIGLHADRTGNEVYVRPLAQVGSGLVHAYDISNPARIIAGRTYKTSFGVSGNFYVDADTRHLYDADAGARELDAIQLSNGKSVAFKYDDAATDSMGVTSYPHSPAIYGLSTTSAVQFDQATGTPQVVYGVHGRVRAESLVVTPNGRMMYVEDHDDPSDFDSHAGLGFIGASKLFLSGGTSTISGTLFKDANLDGIREKKERSHALDAIVYLDVNGDGRFWDGYGGADEGEPSVAVAVTGDGTWHITVPGNLIGSYAVRVATANPPGVSGFNVHTAFAFGTSDKALVTVGDGAQVDGVMFGGIYGGHIEGYVVYDDNGDGDYDGDEYTDDGAVVYLDLNHNGRHNAGEPTSSDYAFDVRPGTYTLRLKDGTPGSCTVAVRADTDVRADLAIKPHRTFDGTLFRDDNRDGIRDAREPVYAGVRVWVDVNDDRRRAAGEPTAVSAADGSFHIDATADVGRASVLFVDADGVRLTATTTRTRVSLNAVVPVVRTFGLLAPPTFVVSAYVDVDHNRKHLQGELDAIETLDGGSGLTSF